MCSQCSLQRKYAGLLPPGCILVCLTPKRYASSADIQSQRPILLNQEYILTCLYLYDDFSFVGKKSRGDWIAETNLYIPSQESWPNGGKSFSER